MDEELSFSEFLNLKLKQKGFSLRKLSDLSGIATKHLEHMSRGEMDRLPPAPYLRGYIAMLGRVLDFDAQYWWERLKMETAVATSGRGDSLPQNRFSRRTRFSRGTIILFVILALIAGYIALRLPKILGKPQLTITAPAEDGFIATNEDFTLEGTLQNGDQITVNGEEVQVSADGTWKKDVLLQQGPNLFEIKSKKFLGKETDQRRQIFYQPSATTTNTTVPPANPTNGTSTR